MVEVGKMKKQFAAWVLSFLLVILCVVASFPQQVKAGSYDGHDLAVAILANVSQLISSSYWDTDTVGHRQSLVASSRGSLIPTDGTSFILISTGRADLLVATSNGLNPGNERGNWFLGGQYGNPRDEANLQLQLLVPEYQHFLYYDVQFFTVEYPEYIGTQYNDQLTISVNSPSKGVSTYIINVNSGDFVFNARDAPLLGTGYNLFAQSDNPDGVDWLQTTPNTHGADAGATALVGREHPVSPGEVVTITFDLKDVGDNQFDSMAFLDNLHFSGYAKAQILARKTVTDLNGGLVQSEDTLQYDITLSNIGTANQNDNPGNEFEDFIPTNATYVPGSVTAGSGAVNYDSGTNKITWDGSINSQSSVALSFKVIVNDGVANSTKISNQGIVHWDENEDLINEKNELTDDPTINDGVDQDGDGETGDDDPTVVTVWAYEAPTELTEDFADADDIVGGKAMDSYQGQVWFDTSQRSGLCNFEVAPSYFFETPRSFKTKLRASGGIQYWNYSFVIFQCNPVAWECWFACGDSSEYADLNLTFKSASGTEITKINFKYIHVDNALLSSSYQIQLSYHTSSGWVQLSSTDPNGYLRNGWYRLRLEKAGDNTLTYSLEEKGRGIVDTSTDQVVASPFSSLARVEWRSTQEPVVCPIFFWDEHTVELLPIS